ncbi:type II toxin-antitoxin system RelB/DinJ family antitoxin [Nitratifractor sp.]|uniref:type II toxin-antitoxin system RelB/DinJ family antitoxin n=1 Tax=Nitratifractor sp. TaxID=2268144 RepID=UPI0025E02793|nr:type II toxin-antitoxin system RelB/DinJ family antitoxin [Nitratifractor sp.]
MVKSARKQTSIKVDPEAWERAKEIFAGYGISVSDAINIFLHKVQKVGGLPFDMRDDEYREPTKEEILEGLKEAVEEVKLAEQGELKLKTLDEVLNEAN